MSLLKCDLSDHIIFYLGKYIKFYHMLSSQFNFFLDLDSVLVANSESVKKYHFPSWQMVGWNSTILRKPSCVFVLLKLNLTLKEWTIKVLWLCGIVSSPPEWLFDTAQLPLLCVCTPHSGLYTLSATTTIIQINMHISLYNHTSMKFQNLANAMFATIIITEVHKFKTTQTL